MDWLSPILAFRNSIGPADCCICARATRPSITRVTNTPVCCCTNGKAGFDMARAHWLSPVLLAAALAPISFGAVSLDAPAASGAPGAAVTLRISIRVDTGDELASLQLEMEYAADVLDLKLLLGDRPR